MRLCEHLHVPRQGGRFKLFCREGPMGVFSRSGTARHSDQDSPRAPHASSQGCGIRSFDCTKASMPMQGRRRVQHVCIVVNLLSLP